MQLFSQRQKGQLDVYGLWGVLRGQLLTDDSFVFNKVLKRIKESIEHLSDVSEEDEEALLRVKVHTVPMAVALKICPGMRHTSVTSPHANNADTGLVCSCSEAGKVHGIGFLLIPEECQCQSVSISSYHEALQSMRCLV